MWAIFKDWIDSRTGLFKSAHAFLYDEIPRSTGWRNTLGSLVGALVLLQLLTGVLMSLYYVPHPEAAYESVAYVEESVASGNLVRALHYWGASFIIVAVFFHMCRVFYTGAYRKPREATWLVGILLFGTLLGLAFTGQLLPWNQVGYWAAQVGIQIVSSTPLVGDAIRRLLVGGETLGALTLTRFYTLHVVVLPLVLGVLVITHLYLLRRHGPARPAWDNSSATEPFFPRQFFRDMVTISAGFVALGFVSIMVGGPQAGPVDLTDSDYVPRPEWYLLAHYEILRLTPGDYKLLATFVLPAVFVLLLLLLPWFDRSRSAAFRTRPVLVGVGSALIAGIVGLTAYGVAAGHVPNEYRIGHDNTSESDEPSRMVQEGRQVYARAKCRDCHKINGRGREIGPDLSFVGTRLREDYLRDWLRNPGSFRPDTTMPPVTVNERDFERLVAYLMSLRADGEQ